MASAEFVVVHAGPLVTIQDSGRPGLMRYGVPASGPMDRRSHVAANRALGNSSNATAIEVSIGGLIVQCTKGSVTVAVCGGGFQVDIAGEKHSSWVAATICAGNALSIKPGPWGAWTYLAFAGNLVANKWLGSSSTHAPSGLGGGRIVTGQLLKIEDAEIRGNCVRNIPCPVSARPKSVIRVVQGPQHRLFDSETLQRFYAGPFTLSDAYDRMGVRLRGPSLNPAADLGVPSEAIVRGSIQISGEGVATVLLADHQTTGGYPKIATIIDPDLDNFAQLRSKSAVAFKPIGVVLALTVARTRARLGT